MKKRILLFIVLVVSILLQACNDDECDCKGQIVGKWKVDGFMSIESVSYSKDNSYSPFITFNSDGTYDVELDVNACSGDYLTGSNDSLSISDIACTEICCDSYFSEKFVDMLSQVSAYNISDDELWLIVTGWGWVVLNRVSE